MTELKTFFNIEIGVFRKSCLIRKQYGFDDLIVPALKKAGTSLLHKLIILF
ncbi:TPA: hypothetical protein I8Z35_001852 [Legionella pneumophila]|uniref:hypothetical protein n=1 Tax=Legionella pneumophila TaxID=446 RepID=UPI000A775E1D|nr:hypothetical protein [Legionella pneumophila]HAT1877088.1 hypothetical protein [Legionella pneumophila]HBD7326958.1 hypothetical protein [Legionella pneumophila]HCU6024833.1 hypothetical protein [Legionella pneumophila]HDR0610619.1 hypothetical protein [Legionella pneumophila]